MPQAMKADNVSLQLNGHFPSYILEVVRYASDIADSTEKELFLVGGAVRDLLLNRTNLDIDLVIEGDAIALARRIAENMQAKLTIHTRFGTAKIRFSDFSIDIATARRETYRKPGALPAVQQGTIRDDLYRRDFTINAMAVSLSSNNFGTLIDIYGGKDDLAHHMIRILHPRSFIDDATRMLRACRYEQRLSFSMEQETSELVRQNAMMLHTISGDRLRRELDLIFKEEIPERILKRTAELDLLGRLHPSLRGNGWLDEKYSKARRQAGQGNLPLLYLCLLVYNLDDNEINQFISFLNFPKNAEKAMVHTLQLKAQLPQLAYHTLKRSDIFELLDGYTLSAVQANMIATESATAAENLELYLNKLRSIRTLLSGKDLINLGIHPGPQFTVVFKELHRAKLNGEVSTRKDEEILALHLLDSL
jgi:tRNA nucleotidyltransferase (CCA-adding enzyme)